MSKLSHLLSFCAKGFTLLFASACSVNGIIFAGVRSEGIRIDKGNSFAITKASGSAGLTSLRLIWDIGTANERELRGFEFLKPFIFGKGPCSLSQRVISLSIPNLIRRGNRKPNTHCKIILILLNIGKNVQR